MTKGLKTAYTSINTPPTPQMLQKRNVKWGQTYQYTTSPLLYEGERRRIREKYLETIKYKQKKV